MVSTFELGKRTAPENSIDEELSKKMKMDLTISRYDNTIKSIEDLPAELILKILKHVPLADLVKNVSTVSKKFYQLSLDSSRPVSFKISSETCKVAFCTLMKRFNQINDIVIYKVDRHFFFKLAPIISSLPKLTRMKLSLLNYDLPPRFLEQIFEKGKLEKFVILGNRMKPVLKSIEKCTNLKHLQLDHSISMNELQQIKSLTHLKILELTTSLLIDPHEFAQIIETSAWSSLEELTLTFVSLNSDCLETVGKKCPNLRKAWIYSICQSTLVPGSSLNSLLKSCQQLDFLFLSFKHLGTTIKYTDNELIKKFTLNYVWSLLPHVTFIKK